MDEMSDLQIDICFGLYANSRGLLIARKPTVEGVVIGRSLRTFNGGVYVNHQLVFRAAMLFEESALILAKPPQGHSVNVSINGEFTMSTSQPAALGVKMSAKWIIVANYAIPQALDIHIVTHEVVFDLLNGNRDAKTEILQGKYSNFAPVQNALTCFRGASGTGGLTDLERAIYHALVTIT